MDGKPQPYFEWVPDEAPIESMEDLMMYSLPRIEAQWNTHGWDQPFTVGIMFKSDVPDLGFGALSVGIVGLPEPVVEDPESTFLLFAKLIAQSVYKEEFEDHDFRRFLFSAAVGTTDQDLDAPREWMRNALENGGDIVGWFAICEGFNLRGANQDIVAVMTEEEIRRLPGVTEERTMVFCSTEQYLLYLHRVRGADAEPPQKTTNINDGMSAGLGLLTAASLRMKVQMSDEVG